MRLWHYKLIPVLPKDMLVSQWRECIAIKRQWEKGTLKHRLVSYVKDYDKRYFATYVRLIVNELTRRHIIYQSRYLFEIDKYCKITNKTKGGLFKEHNNRYLKQCYYNLQEKYDRGIITEEEWQKIDDLFRSEVK